MNSSWKPGEKKQKKGGGKALSFDFDDSLGDLLGDDRPTAIRKPNLPSTAAGSSSAISNKQKSRDADFYSNIAAEMSDVSEADANDLANQLDDIDGLDANLFGSGKLSTSKTQPRTNMKKEATRPVSAPDSKKTVTFSPPNSPPKTAEPPAIIVSPRRDSLKSQASIQELVKKDVQQQMKAKTIDFGDIDEDDPLAGLLSDDEDAAVEKKTVKKSTLSSSKNLPDNNADRPPTRSGARDEKPPLAIPPSEQGERPKSAKRREDIIFSDDDDDVLGGMGLKDDSPRRKVDSKDIGHPARSAMDSLLKNDINTQLLKPSPSLEKREFVLDSKYLKSNKEPSKKEAVDEDFTFGSYRPSSATTGRSSRAKGSGQRSDFLSSLGFAEDGGSKPPSSGGGVNRTGLSATLPDDFGGTSWLDMASGEQPAKTQPAKRDTEKQPAKKAVTLSPRADWLGLTDDGDKNDVDAHNWMGFAAKPSTKNADISEKTPDKIKEPAPRKASFTDDNLVSQKPTRPKSDVLPTPKSVPVTSPSGEDLLPGFGKKQDEDLPFGFGERKMSDSGQQVDNKIPNLDLDGDLTTSQAANNNFSKDEVFSSPPKWEINSLPWDTGSRRPRRELGTSGPKTPASITPANQRPDNISMITSTPITTEPDVQMYVQMQQQLKQQQAELERQQQQWLAQQQQKQQALLQQQQKEYFEAQMKLSSLPHSYHPATLSTPVSTFTNIPQTELEGKVKRLEIEKQHVEILMETCKKQHQDEINALQDAHRKQMQLTEDTFQRREKRMKEETESLIAQNTARIKQMENARSELLLSHQQKLEEWTMDKQREIERIREQNRLSIEDLKKDHDAMVLRIKHARQQELEAVADVQSQTRSLQAMMDKLENNTRSLGDLSYKVGTQHVSNLDERELYIRNKEQEVKRLQEQLQIQHDENDKERSCLQALITKMEIQMREQTKQIEQERWKIKQEQNKVDSMSVSLEEEKKIVMDQLNREKQDVQRAKDNILTEQKQVMSQLYQERRELADEKSQFAVQQRMWTEQQQKGAVKNLHAEAEYDASLKSLSDERNKLTCLSDELKREHMRMTIEKADLDAKLKSVAAEKSRLAQLASQMKTKSQEIDKIAESAAQVRDEGNHALSVSRKVESEQMERLQSIQTQLASLHTKEKNIAQERLNLAKEKRDIEDARSSMLCTACKSPLHGQNNFPLYQGQSPLQLNNYIPLYQGVSNKSMNGFNVPAITSNTQSTLHAGQYLSRTIELDQALRIWEIEAEKDKHYLDDQQIFLEGIKRAPYHKH